MGADSEVLTPEARERLTSRAAGAGEAKGTQLPTSSLADYVPARDRPDPVRCRNRKPPHGWPSWRRSGTAGRWPRHPRFIGEPRSSWLRPGGGSVTEKRWSVATGICRTMGLFASPERNLVFDINDFDETLPGPWERDVKRLLASWRKLDAATASTPRHANTWRGLAPRVIAGRCWGWQ